MRYKLFLVSLVALSFMGCTKPRPEGNAPGQGRFTHTIQSFDNKCYSVRTLEPEVAANSALSAAENIKIDEGVMNFYPLVGIETDAPLAQHKFPFRGKPNTNSKYQLCNRLTKNWLLIDKIAPKELIHYLELPYAEELKDGSGNYRVPVMGYKIQYISFEKIKDNDFRDTNLFMENTEQNKDQASHIKLDMSAPTLLDASKVKDVYPIDYFTRSEWYFAEAVVGTSDDEVKRLGDLWTYDSDFHLSSRIRFLPNTSSERNSILRAVSVAIDPKLESKLKNENTDHSLDYATVVTLKIRPMSYKLKRLHQNDHELVLEENKDIPLKDRKYAEISFETARTPNQALRKLIKQNTSIEPYLGLSPRFTNLEITKNYFSFTIENKTTNRKIKMAFKRVDPNNNYQPMTYKTEDQKRYGYYATGYKQKLNASTYRMADLEDNTKVMRFSPGKKVVYHISESSPDKPYFRNISRVAIDVWNAALKEAGANLRLELSDETAPLGNINYNLINFIDSITTRGIGGYGPTLFDPRTGEVVAATTNIHTRIYHEMAAANIRLFIKRNREGGKHHKAPFYRLFLNAVIPEDQQQQQTEDTSLNAVAAHSLSSNASFGSFPFMYNVSYGSSYNNISSDPHKLSAQLQLLNPFAGSLAVETNPLIAQLSSAFEKEHRKDSFINRIVREKRLMSGEELLPSNEPINVEELEDVYSMYKQSPYVFSSQEAHNYIPSGSKNYDKDIKKLCPEILEFAQSLQPNEVVDTKVEIALIDSCYPKIMLPSLVSAAVHEIGHNLGLRHNFMASADKVNFFSLDEMQAIYGHIPEIAARIHELDPSRLPISSSVMDYAPGEFHLSVPGKYDIATMAKAYGNESSDYLNKSYLYCSDIDKAIGISPLCDAHDYGSTPMEITQNTIQNFKLSFASRNFRGDAYYLNNEFRLALQRMFTVYFPLKKIYDQWRFYLSEFRGQGKYKYNADYNDMGPARYEQDILNAMKEDPHYGPLYKQYYPASRAIYDFFKSVAFMPNHYCVGTIDGKIKLVELEHILRYMAKTKKEGRLESCSDNDAQFYLSNAFGISYDYVGEIGHPLNSISYDYEYYNQENSRDSFSFAHGGARELSPKDVAGSYIDRLIVAYFMTSGRMVLSINHWEDYFLPSMMDEPDLKAHFTEWVRSRLTAGVNLEHDLRALGIDNSYFEDDNATDKMDEKGDNKYFPFFKEESYFLTFTYDAFYRSMFVPDKIHDSLENFKAFRAVTRIVKDPNKVAFELPDSDNFFIQPSSHESHMAAAFITRANLVDSLVKMDKVEESYIHNTFLDFKLKLKHLEEGRPYMIGWFVDFYRRHYKPYFEDDKGRNTIPRSDKEGIKMALDQIFGPEIQIIGPVSKKASMVDDLKKEQVEQGHTFSDSDYQANERKLQDAQNSLRFLMNTPFDPDKHDLYNSYLTQTYRGYSVISPSELDKRLDMFFETQKLRSHDMPEFDQQLNILTQLLMFYSYSAY